jgi:hypothetical protein
VVVRHPYSRFATVFIKYTTTCFFFNSSPKIKKTCIRSPFELRIEILNNHNIFKQHYLPLILRPAIATSMCPTCPPACAHKITAKQTWICYLAPQVPPRCTQLNIDVLPCAQHAPPCAQQTMPCIPAFVGRTRAMPTGSIYFSRNDLWYHASVL